jgi:predicted amidohydrolase
MRELGVAMVQWASSLDPAENRAALASLEVDADLVVLPEAFARDFGAVDDDLSSFAEPQGGPFDKAVRELAGRELAGRELAGRELGGDRTVVAGMFERSADPARPYNTLLVRGAASAAYRKIHLYDSFGYRESDRLTAGPWEPVVVDVGGFAVGLLTCYDLRFPELARALVDAGAEVLVVPAAWVPGRTDEEHALKLDHWRTLARARAIENTAYVVAVGQPGPRYSGCSLTVGPSGTVVAEAGAEPAVVEVVLRRSELELARSTNPSLANRRTPAG